LGRHVILICVLSRVDAIRVEVVLITKDNFSVEKFLKSGEDGCCFGRGVRGGVVNGFFSDLNRS
jgi:hypothetical protein